MYSQPEEKSPLIAITGRTWHIPTRRLIAAAVFIAAVVLTYLWTQPGTLRNVLVIGFSALLGVCLQPLPKAVSYLLHAKTAAANLVEVSADLENARLRIQVVANESGANTTLFAQASFIETDLARIQGRVNAGVYAWETITPGVADSAIEQHRKEQAFSRELEKD